jgi:hypothetical protein
MGKWDINDNDFDTQLGVRNMDEYEQELMNLKIMVNTKKLHPSRIKPYDLAIDRLVKEIYMSGRENHIPLNIIKSDISNALQGGRYRSAIPPMRETSDTIDIDRKRKSAKPKPKRKTVKCSCKKK